MIRTFFLLHDFPSEVLRSRASSRRGEPCRGGLGKNPGQLSRNWKQTWQRHCREDPRRKWELLKVFFFYFSSSSQLAFSVLRPLRLKLAWRRSCPVALQWHSVPPFIQALPNGRWMANPPHRGVAALSLRPPIPTHPRHNGPNKRRGERGPRPVRLSALGKKPPHHQPAPRPPLSTDLARFQPLSSEKSKKS